MPRTKRTLKQRQSALEKLQTILPWNQSNLSLILGILIVVVAGVLIFNYFQKGSGSLGPAQQTSIEDVKPENLPGKYTVKEGDTLFKIAEHYYNDGYKFSQIAETNKLANADLITAGQVLEIPKLEVVASGEQGVGGAENQTIWGEKITGDTYTVVEDDWLSKIAGRAYGDIMAYPKIAAANNIQNPDLIFPGQVLKIPR